MGNILFSELFEQENNPSSEESIINLSDNCIKMLVRGVSNDNTVPAPAADKTPTTGVDEQLQPDDEWIKKLKVLDDIHSNDNGLTIPAVEDLLTKVESQVDKTRTQACPTCLLLMCLKKNENCMIKCNKLINEFIDCVDQSRIELVKERIEAEHNIINEEAITNELATESSE